MDSNRTRFNNDRQPISMNLIFIVIGSILVGMLVLYFWSTTWPRAALEFAFFIAVLLMSLSWPVAFLWSSREKGQFMEGMNLAGDWIEKAVGLKDESLQTRVSHTTRLGTPSRLSLFQANQKFLPDIAGDGFEDDDEREDVVL